ncbi:ssDNA-binding protein, partial [Xenorhabdus bovienii]|uniref:ssDNA-binding protein n=1 Tax=Xenorhabdus bovienii TaxID=40576 RepID=UPI0023B316FE
ALLAAQSQLGVKPRILGVPGHDNLQVTAQDGRPYSGCYVNATISIYPYDNTYIEINLAGCSVIAYFNGARQRYHYAKDYIYKITPKNTTLLADNLGQTV